MQASQLYEVNHSKAEENKILSTGKATVSDSLFSKFARKHGVHANNRNTSYDLVMMKFDYGVDHKKPGHKRLSTYDLRADAYKNGVDITWRTYNKEGQAIPEKDKKVTYQMLYRSTGKAKEGECVFVKDDLTKKYRDYLTMGLWDKMPHNGAKIVELSAYAPLITATAQGFVTLPIDNIFVAEDMKIQSSRPICAVKMGKEDCYEKDWEAVEKILNDHCYTLYRRKLKKHPEYRYIAKKEFSTLEDIGIEEETPMRSVGNGNGRVRQIPYCYVDYNDKGSYAENTIWDGMGLVDSSLVPDGIGGFMYCRSHFFKSCLFAGNLQEWFKDYYGDNYETATVTDMFGRKMKVTDVKVIVTDNSLKWLKFKEIMSKKGTKEGAFRYWARWMKKRGEEFGIVKTEHASKYGDVQRSSFQINNTLLTTDEEVLRRIAAPSVEYCNLLKTDVDAYIDFLKTTGSGRYSINNVLVALYENNPDVVYWKWWKEQRTKKISDFKKDRLQQGKLLHTGDNLVICGNPIALLMAVTADAKKKKESFVWQEGCFDLEEDAIQCYTESFAEGEYLAGFRSPHNSMNNIVHLHNVYPMALRKYFSNLGRNVIVINGIGTDVQDRLNGQDLDSDSIYATSQPDIVELARKAYTEYPTIINKIPLAGTREYSMDMESFARMDHTIHRGQTDVGYASNLAQLALSYWFDGDGHLKHDKADSEKKLEDVFVICSVLAQVAIDSAKRAYEINVQNELSRIGKLPCMKKDKPYPVFLAAIQKYKDQRSAGKKKNIPVDQIREYNCPMDILYRIIENEVTDLRKDRDNSKETRPASQFYAYDTNTVNANRKQYQKVIGMLESYDKEVKKLDKTSASYAKDMESAFAEIQDGLKNTNIKGDTMRTLIAYALADENRKVCNSMLTVLYDKNPQKFVELFKKGNKIEKRTIPF